MAASDNLNAAQMPHKNRSLASLGEFASRDFGGLTVAQSVRELDPDRVSALADAIKESGRVEPLLIDSRNKELRDGHHRYAAAQSLGMKTVPTTNRM